MTTYMPNHGTRILDQTLLMTVLLSVYKLLRTRNISRSRYLMITTLPPLDLQKILGGAQWNRPLNQLKIMKMKVHNKVERMTNLPKKILKIHQRMTFEIPHKTPKIPQKTPKIPRKTPKRPQKTHKILHCKKNP